MNEHLTTNTLIDYVHGELPSAEDALAHTHLQSCTECRSEFERETRLSEALRFAAAEDERELPSMVKAEIWQAVRAARPSPYARFATWLQPLVAVPAAAAGTGPNACVPPSSSMGGYMPSAYQPRWPEISKRVDLARCGVHTKS